MLFSCEVRVWKRLYEIFFCYLTGLLRRRIGTGTHSNKSQLKSLGLCRNASAPFSTENCCSQVFLAFYRVSLAYARSGMFNW